MQYPRRVGETRSRGCWLWLRYLPSLVVLTLTAPMLSSCSDQDEAVKADVRVGTPPAGSTAAPVAIADLVENPEQYVGKVVTVTGEVGDVLGPKGFTLGGEEFLSPGELLVTSPSGFPALPNLPRQEALVEDDIVQATGTVHLLRQGEIEPVFLENLFGKDDRSYLEWDGRPVLVVTSMVTTPRARPRNSSGELHQAPD